MEPDFVFLLLFTLKNALNVQKTLKTLKTLRCNYLRDYNGSAFLQNQISQPTDLTSYYSLLMNSIIIKTQFIKTVKK